MKTQIMRLSLDERETFVDDSEEENTVLENGGDKSEN